MPAVVTVTYQINGYAYAPEVTYRTGTGTITEHPVNATGSQQKLSDEYTAQVKTGDPVSITVESKFYGDQSVGCIIKGSQGQVIAINTADGQLSKASCDGVAA